MEKELSRAARKAINELELPCEVVTVSRLDDTHWRIQFTPGFGQITESFEDENGESISVDEITEIFKEHLLSMEEIRVRHSER
jgi:hypothetical protein